MSHVRKCLPKEWSSRRALDAFYGFLKYVTTAITYGAFYIFGSEVTWVQMWNEKFDSRKHTDLVLAQDSNLDLLLQEAKESQKTAEARHASISDKCKTLLTLSSMILAFVSVLLPRTSIDLVWTKFLFFAVTLLMMVAVILFTVFFGVRTGMRITITQKEAEFDKDAFKKALINSYFQCATDQENQNDYLVEVFKVARFFFLSALMALVLLFAVNFFITSPAPQVKAKSGDLRSDTNFLQSAHGENSDQAAKIIPGPVPAGAKP